MIGCGEKLSLKKTYVVSSQSAFNNFVIGIVVYLLIITIKP